MPYHTVAIFAYSIQLTNRTLTQQHRRFRMFVFDTNRCTKYLSSRALKNFDLMTTMHIHISRSSLSFCRWARDCGVSRCHLFVIVLLVTLILRQHQPVMLRQSVRFRMNRLN